MEKLIFLRTLLGLCGHSCTLEAGPATVRPVLHSLPFTRAALFHSAEQGHLFLQDLEKPAQHKEREV